MKKPEHRLALGTVQFGLAYGVANKNGAVPLDEVAAILDAASELGIDTLDTAVGYGESEAVLGKLDAGRFAIVSKLPGVPPVCPDIGAWVEEQLNASLTRLGVARLSGLLLHRPSELLGSRGDALYEALSNARRQGLADKIGISIYGPDELEVLCARYDFDLIQAPLNLLDKRMIESGWAKRLREKGTELHARSAFLQGLLLMPSHERPARFARFAPVWECWETWLRENRLTPLQACLRFALSRPEIGKLVVGVDSRHHLREIANAADGMLPGLPAWPQPLDPTLINPSVWNTL